MKFINSKILFSLFFANLFIAFYFNTAFASLKGSHDHSNHPTDASISYSEEKTEEKKSADPHHRLSRSSSFRYSEDTEDDESAIESFSEDTPYATAVQGYSSLGCIIPTAEQETVSAIEKAMNLADVQKTSHSCIRNDELNFGVLIHNRHFKVYRSTGLGDTGLPVLSELLKTNGLEPVKKIIYMNKYGYKYTAVELLKSAWAKGGELLGKPRKHHSDPKFARKQQAAADRQNIPFLDKKKGNFYVDGIDPSSPLLNRKPGGTDSVYNVLEEILSNTEATDFHCKGGIHRTGMIALLMRYLQGGPWTQDDQEVAALPAKRDGDSITAFVRNPAELEYYHHNPKNFRQENLAAVRRIAQEPRFQCLKRAFGCALNEPSEHETIQQCYADMKNNEGCPTPANIDDKETRFRFISACGNL